MKRAAASASNRAALIPREEVASSGYDPPKIIDRDVVATRHKSDDFGDQLAARAWHLGLFAATRKAFIGDGSSWIWTAWDRHFKAFGFVPILDFIHALTRVYAAAMAGRSQADGWEIYQRWITWVWQGEVTKVIAERVRDALCLIDRQLRMRSSIPLFVPAGTPDNSPPFQRWGCGGRGNPAPSGAKDSEGWRVALDFPAGDFQPQLLSSLTGLHRVSTRSPSDKSLGYFQPSLPGRRTVRLGHSQSASRTLAELAQRQQELGPPTLDDSDTSPRRIVSDSLTYHQNQQARMHYAKYRKEGLPITSAHMESTVKQINRRIKGSEKYWSEPGAEDLLQLTADHLSTSQPLTPFWHTRPHQQTGMRSYTKHAV